MSEPMREDDARRALGAVYPIIVAFILGVCSGVLIDRIGNGSISIWLAGVAILIVGVLCAGVLVLVRIGLRKPTENARDDR